jgi:hypothetical protein
MTDKLMVTITREKNQADPDQGTFGELVIPGMFRCVTIELPWRDNKPGISCLPLGTYELEWSWSNRFNKYLYLIKENIPDRSGFRIHSGNFAGDVAMGYKSNSEGCILLGTSRGVLNNQKAALSSQIALGRFHDAMKEQAGTLVIREE